MTDNEIRTEVRALEDGLRTALTRYQQRVRVLDSRLVAVRKECPHSEVTHHADPSGNNDSTVECLVCGKEARRL